MAKTHFKPIKRTTPDIVAVADRRQRVWELRLQGFSIEQIAQKLNCDRNTVIRDIEETYLLCSELTLRHYEMWRELELARLDALDVRNRALLESDDPRVLSTAIQNALAISAARRKLLGIDAPRRQEIDASGSINIRIIEETADEPESGLDA